MCQGFHKMGEMHFLCWLFGGCSKRLVSTWQEQSIYQDIGALGSAIWSQSNTGQWWEGLWQVLSRCFLVTKRFGKEVCRLYRGQFHSINASLAPKGSSFPYIKHVCLFDFLFLWETFFLLDKGISVAVWGPLLSQPSSACLVQFPAQQTQPSTAFSPIWDRGKCTHLESGSTDLCKKLWAPCRAVARVVFVF